jgi:hypothetical protein
MELVDPARGDAILDVWHVALASNTRHQGLLPASLQGRSVIGNCEETIHRHFPRHMGDHSSVKRRDMFAHGDVHGLHDVQLLQELRTARRSVQHLPVLGELTQ